MKLNKQQQEVVDFREGNCIVISAGGSGKTRVIVERVKSLVDEGVQQDRILVITFTKDSAEDLKKRLGKNYSNVEAKTFHAFCLKYLNKYGKGKDLFFADWKIEKYFKDMFGKDFDTYKSLSWISYQKNNGLNSKSKKFKSKEAPYDEYTMGQIFTAYQEYLRKNKMRDFDDMLLDFAEMVKKDKNIRDDIAYYYKYIMVDEHQDSNEIQEEILRLISGNGNLLAVGDFRQAIFGFRGSNIDLILNFHKKWENSKVIMLPTNYRSTDDIIEFSNRFIKQQYGKHELYTDSLHTSKGNGTIQVNPNISVCDKIEELINNGTKADDITILYRNHYLSADYEVGLKEKNIPFFKVGEERSFFDRPEIDAIIGYIALSLDNTDSKAYQKVYNIPNRFLSRDFLSRALSKKGNLLSYKGSTGFEEKGVNSLIQVMRNIDMNHGSYEAVESAIRASNIKEHIRVTYNDADDRIGALGVLITLSKKFATIRQFLLMIEKMRSTPQKQSGVKMMTIHASKGLEFNNVFVVNVDDGILPHFKSSLEEEIRLFYVAISRPIHSLYIYSSPSSMQSEFIQQSYSILNDMNMNG